jgi:hypothetical protein
MLHSFWYGLAEKTFVDILAKDPACTVTAWGYAAILMSNPLAGAGASAAGAAKALAAIDHARANPPKTQRERDYVEAVAAYYEDWANRPEKVRQAARAKAFEALAAKYPDDDEAQIFSALYIAGTQSQADQTYSAYLRAVAILEPEFVKYPDHPGVAHYLIHSYDAPPLAAKGVLAARRYADIAPDAPHALHMPSHIFTRLGLWDDSIRSNEAARRVAREQGDVGEELHAMDYLTYAYLQRGREADAERVLQRLHAMGSLLTQDFKVSYAATAMPVRLAVERKRWSDAMALQPLAGAPPQVTAITHWARALSYARSGQPDLANAAVAQIDACEAESKAHGDAYWSAQIGVLSKEGRAWNANAMGHTEEAVALLRAAADAEDALEKLPVTPGPIVPAREQLGQLLLDVHQPKQALRELTQALKDAPGRRAGLEAAARAAEGAGDSAAAAAFQRLLHPG